MQGVTNGQVKACVHFPQNLMSLFQGRRGGLKPDESQKRGRAAGSLLPQITPSLIATGGSQAQCGVAHSLLAVMNTRCHLPAPIWPAGCQPQEHFVFCTVRLKKKKKSTPLASSGIVARTDKVVTDGWMCGWVGRDYSEEWAGRWVRRVADVYLCGR